MATQNIWQCLEMLFLFYFKKEKKEKEEEEKEKKTTTTKTKQNKLQHLPRYQKQQLYIWPCLCIIITIMYTTWSLSDKIKNINENKRQ